VGGLSRGVDRGANSLCGQGCIPTLGLEVGTSGGMQTGYCLQTDHLPVLCNSVRQSECGTHESKHLCLHCSGNPEGRVMLHAACVACVESMGSGHYLGGGLCEACIANRGNTDLLVCSISPKSAMSGQLRSKEVRMTVLEQTIVDAGL
jgi:hypothetical protein